MFSSVSPTLYHHTTIHICAHNRLLLSTCSFTDVNFCTATKLSYVIDQFYEATNRNPQSCDFGGNATINSQAPTNSAAAASAVSQCLASGTATFVPSAPASTGGSGGGSSPSSGGSGSGSGSQSGNGAAAAFTGTALVGAALSAAFSVLGAALVLA